MSDPPAEMIALCTSTQAFSETETHALCKLVWPLITELPPFHPKFLTYYTCLYWARAEGFCHCYKGETSDCLLDKNSFTWNFCCSCYKQSFPGYLGRVFNLSVWWTLPHAALPVSTGFSWVLFSCQHLVMLAEWRHQWCNRGQQAELLKQKSDQVYRQLQKSWCHKATDWQHRQQQQKVVMCASKIAIVVTMTIATRVSWHFKRVNRTEKREE